MEKQKNEKQIINNCSFRCITNENEKCATHVQFSRKTFELEAQGGSQGVRGDKVH